MQEIQQKFCQEGYIGNRSIYTSVFLAQKLQKPLLIEGPPGVGKTEIAKVLAKIHHTQLIRLQCYEGLDSYNALYDWNYQKQLLYLKANSDVNEERLYSEDFLLKRPLLHAITSSKNVVLLIDEIDRADEEFESFLLEILSDWQISIPETGTVTAQHIPYTILTSNRKRPLSNALRRRCLYLWIDYPSFDKELEILQTHVPQINTKLAGEICGFVQAIRDMSLAKRPGVAETIDWAMSLTLLNASHLEPQIVDELLGVVFKNNSDIEQVKSVLPDLMEQIAKTREHKEPLQKLRTLMAIATNE
ncbi:AAA family ATPase [Candidatus Uabimicrobium amorphum]|uniref:MoxR-like ATPase n=1 Tax=Uabimicrobium amorphum TaxID=2596890 RepID=A0A5S9IJE2_UABAM|nr:MoxR family ATPase [Candidatus Uabimicrobium amorphum]BBM82948.1 MoxR-like ATPase [Candidatus Uabimicrobium amorphum]